MLDQNKSLQNLVNKLPKLKAPDPIWTEIENGLLIEKNSFILKQAIQNLPSHSAKKQTWESFLGLRNKNDLNQNSFSEINQHYENPDLNKIQKKATYNELLIWFGSVAAVILIVVISWSINLPPKELVEISISQESNGNFYLFEDSKNWSETDETLEFLQENCLNLNPTCSMPEFQSLMDNYLDLEKAKQELLIEIERNQEQIQLIKYLARIEKEKNSIGHRLIKMVLT